MKRVLALITVVIIIVIAWLAFGGKNNDNSGITNQNQSPTNSTANQRRAQAVTTDKVVIRNLSFSPASITVKAGTTVTWTNQDSTAHTVTENDGQDGPSSPPLEGGKSYSFTFHKAGAFHYHCTIHPEMTGSVTVTQ